MKTVEDIMTGNPMYVDGDSTVMLAMVVIIIISMMYTPESYIWERKKSNSRWSSDKKGALTGDEKDILRKFNELIKEKDPRFKYFKMIKE